MYGWMDGVLCHYGTFFGLVDALPSRGQAGLFGMMSLLVPFRDAQLRSVLCFKCINWTRIP